MKRLIIFASGRGSNADAIIEHFSASGRAAVALIVTTRADAGVLDIAQREQIPSMILQKGQLDTPGFIQSLLAEQPALIVLAGFLWKVPTGFIEAFRGKIVNIHPALLPAYGGKGMWGAHVHAAVLAAGDAQSGITIHYVDEEYDHGATLLQASCPVHPGDDADALARRVQQLEHFWYPRLIEFLIDNDF